MSQQAAAAKPSLQGVRIKARKGAVKAQAKHEPSSTHNISTYVLFLSNLSQYLETNSTNILKQSQKATLTLTPQN